MKSSNYFTRYKITRYNNKPKINDTNVTVEFEISVRL